MGAQFPDEASTEGEFERQEDAFRDWITSERNAAYPPEPDRYHLYVSLACPWASRTVIARQIKGLSKAIGMTVVDPVRDERGWAFRDGPGYTTDPINQFSFLSEAYRASDPHFDGRVTVPVLWDKKNRRIVNNSEDDICRMFNSAFPEARDKGADLFPESISAEHAELSNFLYENINNGVYRAGFATSQRAYERACRQLFNALDEMERRLANERFLFGNMIVDADWKFFCTLIRFDAVYHGHFKCNLRRIIDYPALDGYLCDLYQQPGIAPTVNLDQIKRHYYITHTEINPTRIVPLGPILELNQPHNRERLSRDVTL
jgi:putative glutathione S-transferase